MDTFEKLSLFLKYFSRLLMLFLIMPVTNSARGLVAKWQGDDSAESAGRITLNPMAHLDPLGAMAIFLCGFGWSKPMPINFSRMKDTKKGVILVSLAGPLTHFLSAILCDLVYKIMVCSKAVQESLTGSVISPALCILIILSILSQINICLGVINLLPIPPMDGFQVLNQLAGAKFHNWYYGNYQKINQYSTIVLLALFFMPTLTNGYIDPLGWLISLVGSLLSYATAWVPHVFG